MELELADEDQPIMYVRSLTYTTSIITKHRLGIASANPSFISPILVHSNASRRTKQTSMKNCLKFRPKLRDAKRK